MRVSRIAALVSRMKAAKASSQNSFALRWKWTMFCIIYGMRLRSRSLSGKSHEMARARGLSTVDTTFSLLPPFPAPAFPVATLLLLLFAPVGPRYNGPHRRRKQKMANCSKQNHLRASVQLQLGPPPKSGLARSATTTTGGQTCGKGCALTRAPAPNAPVHLVQFLQRNRDNVRYVLSLRAVRRNVFSTAALHRSLATLVAECAW